MKQNGSCYLFLPEVMRVKNFEKKHDKKQNCKFNIRFNAVLFPLRFKEKRKQILNKKAEINLHLQISKKVT